MVRVRARGKIKYQCRKVRSTFPWQVVMGDTGDMVCRCAWQVVMEDVGDTVETNTRAPSTDIPLAKRKEILAW